MSSWPLDAAAVWEAPIQTAATAIVVWVISVTAWRMLTARAPPSSHPLACLPIPIVGSILNLLVFFSEFRKLDKERPWDAVITIQNKVGRVFRLPFLFETAYTIVGKEGLKIGLTCKTEDGERVLGIQKHPAIVNIWGKNGLSSTEIGERRDRIKKIMHPTLAPKALQAYLEGMKKDVDAWMHDTLGNLPADGVVRVYQPIRELTMVVPTRMVLGLAAEADAYVDRTRHLLIAMWDGTAAPPIEALGGDYAKGLAARKELVPIIRELIAKRRKEQEGQSEHGIDMLSQLVRASDEQGKLTEDEIIDQVVVIFLAGYETSVSLIIVALHYLAKPEYASVLAKLREEQLKFSGELSYADLQAMTYMRNFFYECLRIFPPVQQFAKTVVKSFEFDGHAHASSDSQTFCSLCLRNPRP